MKNRQKKQKNSKFLRSIKRGKQCQSKNRATLRDNLNKPPNSQKIAKSSIDNSMIYRTNKFECNFNRKGKIIDKAA